MLEERAIALPLQLRALLLNASPNERPQPHSPTAPKTIPRPKQLTPTQELPLRIQLPTCSQPQATTTQPQEFHDMVRLPIPHLQLLKSFLDQLLRPMRLKAEDKKDKEKSRVI